MLSAIQQEEILTINKTSTGTRDMLEIVRKIPVIRIAVVAALSSTLVVAESPALAQSASPPICTAFESFESDADQELLRVACGGSAVTLGAVDAFEMFQLPALDAAVVVTTLDGSRRAFLVISNGKDGITLEEITGAIAHRAGRGARSDIADLQLEFGRAESGLITAATNSSEGRGALFVEIDVAAMIEHSRAVRGNSLVAGGQ